ncbi:dTDP-4-amino-4,6-dideoxygalactose transaminase [Candidatus Beckwithbacteria bacterium CG22_combo_CG10-13_8_21_14_all_01_47_9]|uniref:dTDP-4-amino-4,6-dideoxygalactose transaminase n=3 Tax=Candidatus Beckwithiibacteriota TaxID=1752726 RepID=A0A2H0E144_9BACT|nr:MAG: dTDP-4-amino-4,6-dideoxygalactose transaminase [Candidatus Beckwithbacteria bacterium CG22_combo_CG10-13_8_21_14_all_01_47_9]PJA22649.1 MAG: dTDP-4-amino-4,6-dideoxygalactose transaminase [Candidatus Beckwithbacteria bacterium CG_4_10_14_0_2_um_filter_47_25]PJC66041.1 MAG: dTDP-4-amino-4,6-dideoxygalactose transaminase [Candidatus Beckwithbacteria bacterium CG_4_9_14_0_2_um_filter_47_11]
MNVRFFKPYITGNEIKYIRDIIDNVRDMSGDAVYTRKVHVWFERRYRVPKALMTTSGTTALEMAVKLLNLRPGDEVITPSFTFSSTVNAILLANGLRAVFAEIDPSTLNIDPADIARKITAKTKALMVVHYAGVSVDMDAIMKLAKKHQLKVVEDAAQGIVAKYRGKYLGTIGDFGCLSFHDTKNITCGEGGVLLINSKQTAIHEAAEIMREKGTNRSKFFRGLVDKYTWVNIGSSYLPSDLLAAFLYAQLEQVDKIISLRRRRWDYYFKKLTPYAAKGLFQLPGITPGAEPNAHIFYILLPTGKQRDEVLAGLRAKGIAASFHYIPLHSAPQGIAAGGDPQALPVTTAVSERLLRLPLFSQITRIEQDYVINNLLKCLNV